MDEILTFQLTNRYCSFSRGPDGEVVREAVDGVALVRHDGLTTSLRPIACDADSGQFKVLYGVQLGRLDCGGN